MEITVRQIFVSLYCIFWATSLLSVGRYLPFETNEFFKKDAMLRFAVSFGIMNVLPAVCLWIILSLIIPAGAKIGFDIKGLRFVLAGTFASLSVFGFHRILHAVVATEFWDSFYSDVDTYNKVMEKWAGPKWKDRTNTFKSHCVPGLIYVILFPIIALLLRNPGFWIIVGLVVAISLFVILLTKLDINNTSINV